MDKRHYTFAIGYAINAAIGRWRYTRHEGKHYNNFFDESQPRGMLRKHDRDFYLITPEKKRKMDTMVPSSSTVGVSHSFTGTQKSTRVSTLDNVADKVIQIKRCIELPFDVDGQRFFNRRQSAWVNIKSLKFNSWITLNSAMFEPMSVRWAFLVPKKKNSGLVTDITTDDFFVSKDPNVDFASDFPVGVGDGPGTGYGDTWSLMESKINPRLYNVIGSGRKILYPKQSSGDLQYKKSNKLHIKKYIKINKTMHFPNNASEFPATNIYFVYWACPYGSVTDGHDTMGVAGLQERHQKTVYFKPCNALN